MEKIPYDPVLHIANSRYFFFVSTTTVQTNDDSLIRQLKLSLNRHHHTFLKYSVIRIRAGHGTGLMYDCTEGKGRGGDSYWNRMISQGYSSPFQENNTLYKDLLKRD